jgi:NAD(P)-dependent dehydrogenase (short-subunit alcohol dehydrogenase family)
MSDFQGKVVVITGGAGEIGKAAAKLLAGDGAEVLLVDRDARALDAAVAEIGSKRVTLCVADVADVASTQAYIRAAVDRFGGIDVLLSNAGIEGKVAPIFDADPADFDRVIAVNVRGVWLSLKYAIPEMRKRGGGSIVISSSIAGLRGTAGVTPYVTSKHAVVGLMRAAALECAPLGIRINTVNPSPVETRMMRSLEEGLMPGKAEEVHAMLKGMIPMQRYAEADDVAKLMRFLASDDAAFVTGSVHSVDGGLNAG